LEDGTFRMKCCSLFLILQAGVQLTSKSMSEAGNITSRAAVCRTSR
jgi:hypothetical protein